MQRQSGVDLARAVALLGMMTVHVWPSRTADGGHSLVHAVFSGRASALFAVLAGVGLALVSGGARPVEGAHRRRVRVAIVLRAVVVAAIGLLLGELPSGLAVILTYYGLLFLLAVPLLGVRARVLGVVAVGSAAVVPVLLWLVQDDLPRLTANPSLLLLLEHPADLLATLLATGYYPVLAWSAYLLAGLAVGRLVLSDRRVQVGLLAGGLLLAVGASLLSALLLGPLGGRDAIARTLDPGQAVGDALAADRYGAVPTTTGWWLAADVPHGTTPLDLLHTLGSSVAVIGAALLLTQVVRPRVLAPLTALGSMTLTLYSVHVVVMAVTDGDAPAVLYWTQVAAFAAFALVWRQAVGRGPLESLAHAVAHGPPRPVGAAT